MKHKVSDLIARFLAEKRMAHVFGIIGSGNAHIFDSIHFGGQTEMVCVHHEQAACMAMQTYYRLTGIVSASILTTGAGSTNGVTGVVSAWADSIPGLIISGNENSRHTTPENPLRMWGIQGYDSVEMVARVTKYGARVNDPRRILFELEKAYFEATSGRPGPCWIDVPMNVQSATVDEADLVRFSAPTTAPSGLLAAAALEQEARAIVGELLQSQRPLLWLGHGIRLAGAQPLLQSLLERLPFPTLVSWAGIDMVDSEHPCVFGRAGVYGQRAANFILQNCDYLLSVGTRLAVPQVGYELSELARGARIAVVDIDSTELEKHRTRLHRAIPADAKAFLEALLRHLPETPVTAPADWWGYCQRARADFPTLGPEHADAGGFINSYPFMERLHAHLKPDQVIVTDMGTALLAGHQILRLKPGQRLLTSTGLGEMGYGLPGAIGASFARHRGEVLCLNCDGGMMMNLQELQTMVHHQLPIKLVIFNNDGYLMIKHTQNAVLQGRHAGVDRASGVSCPDFSKLATAFGIPAFQIRTWEDFDRVLPELQSLAGPAICEVFTHPLQPFVPKLSLAQLKDGSYVSPPLEDLSPFISRDLLRRQMLSGLHPKSESITG
jgi:acetolactate synthase-1/2/3 large subunit